MLSRIAEDLYWIGRNIERAEDTTRLFSVYYYGSLEAGSLDLDLLPTVLNSSLGGDLDIDLLLSPFEQVAKHLLTDATASSSVISCLHIALGNARRTRQVLPMEMWQMLNRTVQELDLALAPQDDFSEFFFRIPTITAEFFGLLDSIFPRDPAWQFIKLGIALERVDMTLRTLLVANTLLVGQVDPGPLSTHEWSLCLRACAALDCHRKTIATLPDRISSTLLLLQAKNCPRSVLFSLQQVKEFLPATEQPFDEVEEIITEVEFNPVQDLLTDTPKFINHLLQASANLHLYIVANYLRWDEHMTTLSTFSL